LWQSKQQVEPAVLAPRSVVLEQVQVLVEVLEPE
jgi:hypothetical protein